MLRALAAELDRMAERTAAQGLDAPEPDRVWTEAMIAACTLGEVRDRLRHQVLGQEVRESVDGTAGASAADDLDGIDLF